MVKCNWCSIEKINESIYALIDKDGGWFLSNTGIINMGSYTLVIDTQYNESRAKDIINIINDLGFPKVGLILNTHPHGDHAWGNHVFNVPSIMHKNANNVVEASINIGAKIYEQFFPNLDFKGSKYTLPDIIVGDEGIVLKSKDGEINVKYLGPAHTPGDLIADIDWANTVFAGDLVFNEVTPLAIDGTVLGWINALDKLEIIADNKKIVGGHGGIADKNVIKLIKEYLQNIANGTKESLSLGIYDPLAIAERIGTKPLDNWKLKERIVLNVARAIMDYQNKKPGEIVTNLPELAFKMAKFSL